jgi:tetratricopeptide (TPR) repeat protein
MDILEKAGKWHSLAELIQSRVNRLPDAQRQEKLTLLGSLIPIYRDKMNAESKVISVYQAMLKVDPSDRSAQEALAAFYEQGGRWPDLVKTLKAMAETETDPEKLLELHRRTAVILMDRFSNMAEAMKSYEAILELRPGDRDSIEKLKDIYDKRRDWTGYIKIALLEVDAESSVERRLARLKELAATASERIARPETGIELWSRVLAEEPDNLEAAAALEGLYEKSKDYAKLVEILTLQQQRETNKARKTAVLEKKALTLGLRLGDKVQAAEAWKELLGLDPENARAKVELRKLYVENRDLPALKWYFANYGNPKEYLRTLETLAREEESPDRKIGILLIMADEFGSSEEKQLARTLEQVLELQPGHEQACRRLIPVYRTLENWILLADMEDAVLASAELDLMERLELLLDKARILEERLGEREQAFFAYIQAFQLDMRSGAIRQELERLADLTGNWDSYVSVLEQTLDYAGDDTVKVGTLIRMAEIMAGNLGQAQEAVRRYRDALELAPTDERILDALERLFDALQAHADLVEILDRKLALAKGTGRRKELGFRRAEVLLDRMGDREAAVAVYRQLLDEDPSDASIYVKLGAILAAAGRSRELYELLTTQFETLGPRQAGGVDLACDLARLSYGLGESPSHAVDLLEGALDLDPAHGRAVAFMEELLSLPGLRLRVATALTAVYELQGVKDRLASVLELRLEDGDSSAESLLEQLVSLYAALGDAPREFLALSRLFELKGGEVGLASRLEELAEGLDAWKDLVALYSTTMESATDTEFRRVLKRSAAGIHHLRLGDLDSARILYGELLDEDPSDLSTMESLEHIAVASQDWDGLFDIYAKEKELATSSHERIEILFRMAEVCEKELKDIPRATVTVEEITALAPGDRNALERLARLYEASEDWGRVLSTLEQLWEMESDSARRSELMLRAAGVLEVKVGNKARMTDILASALELVPGLPAAIDMLQRNLEEDEDGRMLLILDQHFRSTGEWLQVIEFIERKKGRESDPEAIKPLQMEIAEIWEYMLEEPAAAFDAYQAVLAVDPSDRSAVAQVQRLAQALDRKAEVTEVLEDCFRRCETEADKEWIARSLARWARGDLDKPEEAVLWFEQVLEFVPGDLEALDILASVFRETENHPKLVQILRARAQVESDTEKRRELLLELGSVLQDFLDREEDAAEVYNEILELNPLDSVALANLDELLGRLGRFAELAEVLERKASIAEEPELKKMELLRRAEILDVNLARLDDAEEVYRGLLVTDPADTEVLAKIKDLHLRKEDWLAAIDDLKVELELLSGAEKVPYLLSLGQLWVVKLEAPEEGVRVYREVLEIEAGNAQAVDALEDLVLNREGKEAAFALLAPVLEEGQQWLRLVACMEALVLSRGSSDEGVALALVAASLLREKLSDDRRAYGLLAGVFPGAPGNHELGDRLESAALATGLAGEFVEMLALVKEEVSEPSVALALGKRRARILKDEVQDFEGAIQEYSSLRRDFPEDLDALEALDQLYSMLDRAEALEAVLAERMEYARNDGERLELGFRRCLLLEETLGRMMDACAVMKDLHILNPDRPEVMDQFAHYFEAGLRDEEMLGILEGARVNSGDWKGVMAVLEGRLEVAADNNDRLDLARRLARIAADNLGDFAASLRWTGEALVLDPQDEGALVSLKELGELVEDREAVAAYLERAAGQAEADDTHIRLALEAGRYLMNNRGDPERAELFFLDVLDRNAEEVAALASLDDLYGLAARYEEQEKILLRRSEVALDPRERIELLMRLGALREEQLGSREGAADSYRMVRDLDEQYRPALDHLMRLLEGMELYPELLPLYQSVAEFSRDPDERVALYTKVAFLTEDKLHQPEKAIERWEDVLVFSNEDQNAFDNLARLLEGLEKWQELVDLLRRASSCSNLDEARRLSLYRRLALTAEGPLGDTQTAEEFWVRIRSAHRDDPEAQASLKTLFRVNANWQALAELLLSMAMNEELAVATRVELWSELAELRSNEHPSPAAAIEAWNRVLDLEPGRLVALEALITVYQETGAWKEAVETLRLKASLVEGEARGQVLKTMASIYEDYLRDLDAALDCRRQVLKLNNTDLEAYRALEDLLESMGRWAELAELLADKAEVLPVEQKLDAYRRGASVYEENLGEREGAFLLFVKALELEPLDKASLEGVERTAMEAGLHAELKAVWENSVAAAQDPLVSLDLVGKLAALCRDQLGDQNEAVKWFVKLLEVDDESEPALSALVELYSSLGSWEALASVLRKLTSVTTDFTRQTALYLQLGECLYRRMRDSAEAVKAYREVLDMDPTQEAAVEALREIYETTGAWDDLIEILGMRASLHPEEETAIKLARGRILEDKLKDTVRAADEFEDVLAFDPANLDAMARLKVIYTDAGNWKKLAETLERGLSFASRAEDRMEILSSLALLHEEALDDADGAADYHRQILDLLPENLEAVEALERLFAKQERYEDLVEILRRHAAIEPGLGKKVVLLSRASEVFVQQLADFDAAISVQLEIIDLDPANTPALNLLETLYEEQGQWENVLDTLEKKIRISRNSEEILGFYVKRGRILRGELMNPEAAKSEYRMALEREPACAAAVEELVSILIEEEDWARVMTTLQSLAEAIEGEEPKAEVLTRMGRQAKDSMGDAEMAIELFEKALEHAPEYAAAVEPLVDLYIAQERWAKVSPLLDILARRSKGDDQRTVGVLFKMGNAARHMGHNEEALAKFREAYDRDPLHAPTLQGLAELNFKLGRHEYAETYYQRMLDAAGEGLSDHDKMAAYRALGEVEMALGKPAKAEEYLAEVISLRPNDQGCIQDLATLMELHGDFEGVIRYKRKLLELADDGLTRLNGLLEIGDLYKDRLGKPRDAADCYRDALSIQPDSRAALVKLLEIHIQGKEYEDAVDALRRLYEIDDDRQKKAYYTFTIATIYKEHLHDPLSALEYYERTLDLDTDKLEAFQALDEILTRQKDWTGLEEAYRRMLTRIRDKGNKNLEFMLYKNLGEIYRSRLSNLEYATSSFELAVKLRPEESRLHEILAQLYESTGKLDKAVAANRVLASLDPERIECYRNIHRHFVESGKQDEAWVASSVLALLRKAGPEELAFYKEHRPVGLATPKRAMDNTMWMKGILSKAESVTLGEVFQILYEVLGQSVGGKELKDLGLKKKDELDLKERTLFASAFRNAAAALGVQAPKVYISEKTFGIRIENTVPPVIIIGRDMLEQKTDRELAFTIGKYLSYFHPMHILAGVYSAPALRVLYDAALRVVLPTAEIESKPEEIEAIRDELAHKISSALANRLAANINKLQSRPERPSISRWLGGVELSADHAGLLVCGDLETAAKVLSQESVSFSKLPLKEKVKELVLFAVSEEHLALRKALGLTIDA